MKSFSRSHLTDHGLLSTVATRVALDCNNAADLLADLAELDKRKLYAPAGYDSMFEYCLRELHMSEDMAYKRIQAARAARRFPAIFQAVAESRLHLTAVVLLAPHLTGETAEALLAAATHKTKREIELLLAERFPKPDVPTVVRTIGPTLVLDAEPALPDEALAVQLVPEPVASSSAPSEPVQAQPLPVRARPVPLSPGRFALQVTVDQATHDQLRYAQSLLGHAVPSGDVAEVLKRALDALVEKLERQKFAKTDRSRPQRAAAKGRHVPAAVRKTVWERDGGQCTFVSEKGKRCESRTRLEFDHVDAIARGGQSTVRGLRLRCRAHNQYAADCTFGAEFMDGKREESQRRAGETKLRAEARAGAPARVAAP